MKKIFITQILLAFSSAMMAQQTPQFTQFMQTGQILNPAFTGINRNGDFRIGYRKQWVGLSGAPTTMFVSGSAMLGIDEPKITLPVRGRMASQFRTEKPERKDGLKHCVGAFLLLDKTGPTSFNRGGLSYAANYPLNATWRLSGGASLLFSQSSLNRSELNVNPQRDPGISADISSSVSPDLQLGGLLYSDKMFFGYSLNYLLKSKLFSLSETDQLYARQRSHHHIFAGYRLDFGEWAFIPGLMFKMVQGSPAGMETNFRLNYGDKYWFGAAFRPMDAASVFAGIHLSNTLNLSYAYDYNLSSLNAFNNGSHELMLGLRFLKKGEKLYTPKLW